MFGPLERVMVKATGQIGAVTQWFPNDDEYRVVLDSGEIGYFYGGDLTRPGY